MQKQHHAEIVKNRTKRSIRLLTLFQREGREQMVNGCERVGATVGEIEDQMHNGEPRNIDPSPGEGKKVKTDIHEVMRSGARIAIKAEYLLREQTERHKMLLITERPEWTVPL